ncbi:MAG: hypothetical protein KFF49_04790 [Bacteroidales bacterium]|nr:hypothetical protein [Bacteroidales bacterium]
MIRIYYSFFICIAFSMATMAQGNIKGQLSLLYYNADNLFDITDDRGNADDEYLPVALKAWDANRYKAKVSAIAENISLAGNFTQPDIIGLCGVENKKVIKDILAERRLRRADYTIHMPESEGTGAALVVKKDLVTVEEMVKISIDSAFLGLQNAYDYSILYLRSDVKGLGKCHFFLNDWPGIKNNARAPENTKIGAAIALRKHIDAILNFERDAKIIIMGTFYDEPTNRSLMTILNATNKRKNLDHRDLFNLFYDAHNIRGEGTYIMNDTWLMWDQIIVSSPLINESRDYFIEAGSASVFMPDEIHEDKGKLVSTYRGDEYTGGTSAHLPVYCVIRKRE